MHVSCQWAALTRLGGRNCFATYEPAPPLVPEAGAAPMPAKALRKSA